MTMRNIIYVFALVFLAVGCQTTSADKSDREPAQTVYEEKNFPYQLFYTAAGETLAPVNDMDVGRTQKSDLIRRHYHKDIEGKIWVRYYFGVQDHCEVTDNIIYNEGTNLNDIVVRSFKVDGDWIHNADLNVSELPGYSEFTQVGDQIFIAGIPYAKVRISVYDRENNPCYREIADYRKYPPETKITVIELVPDPEVKIKWISPNTSFKSSSWLTPYEVRIHKEGFLDRKVFGHRADSECKKPSITVYLAKYEAIISNGKQRANFKTYNLVNPNSMGCSIPEKFPRRERDILAKTRKK